MPVKHPSPRLVLRRGHFLRPGVGDLLADLTEGLRDRLGLGDDGEEVPVTAPARHHVLVQVAGDARAAGDALVHAEVEAGGVGDLAQHPHGRLGQFGELRRFLDREVRVVRDVPVRADQQVARVVRKEVQHHVARPSPVDDQGVLVAPLGRGAERAVVRVLELVLAALDVRHPVRGPQALESVRDPGQAEVVRHGVVARILRPGPCGFLHALPFRLR